MKTIRILALGLLAAGCSQTAQQASVTPAQPPAGKLAAGKTTPAGKQAQVAQQAQSQATRCAEAAKKAADSQMQAAMLGGALSMVGGLGGFAGTGGMVAAQAASVGGSIVQQQASGKAQAEMRQSC